MEQQEDLILEPLLLESTSSRKRILPLWIKIFSWLFLITGAISILAVFAGMLGTSYQVSLYGLQSNEPFSLTGLLILAMFVFKGIVAFGLLTAKGWAVGLGIVDAVVGIVICGAAMFALPLLYGTGSPFTIRLELALLIPYLIRLQKLKKNW